MAAFTLGIRTFKTKGDATVEVRRILHGSPLDTDLADADLTLVAALYDNHPRKEGTPQRFQVGTNNYHGTKTRGFQAIHNDGSRTSWSYLPCLSPHTDVPKLLAAMRAAIMPSQREALRTHFQSRAVMPCSHCSTGVTLDVAHVHHKPPKFRDIADGFIGLVGLPTCVTAALGDDFAEPETKRRWVLFHDSIAQRVVLCAKCNAADERGA